MFVRNKNLISFLSAAALIILTAIFIPLLRNHLIDSMRRPLEFLFDTGQQVQGIILCRHNLAQNQRIKKEIGLFRRQSHEAKELYLENLRLRELLDFSQASVYPLTAAGVIGYASSNLSSIIVINKGKQQGVSRGSAVITNDGLAGRVIEAGDSTSKVLLVNDINSGVAAFIQRSRHRGLVTGTLAGHLILRYLTCDADVQLSDMVITSGLSGVYPKGILVGEVTKIQKDAGSAETYVVIKPSADLTKLEEVLVVLSE